MTISPKTHLAFQGNELKFSATYSVEGEITEPLKWRFTQDGNSWFSSDPEVTLTLGKTSIEAVAFLSFINEGGQWGLSEETSIRPIFPESGCHPNRDGLLTAAKTGILKISGSRSFDGAELVEGKEIPLREQGKLIVTKSRWKVAGGTVVPQIEKETATETRLIFDEPGHAELVHDIKLAYRYDGEEYVSDSFSPTCSGLFGLFQVRAQGELEKFPPGILPNTSRKLTFKKVTVWVNGVKREIPTSQALDFDPKWILAQSVVFPDSPPLSLSAARLSFEEKETAGFHSITGSGFNHLLTLYLSDAPALSLRPQVSILPDFTPQVIEVFPAGPWQEIRFFPLFPRLVQVAIDPKEPPPVREGESLKFSGTIVPMEDFGTGEIDANQNTLEVLDGYEAVGVETLDWFGYLSEKARKSLPKQVQWAFDFKPQTGSGTYTINAATVVNVREKDTGTEAQIEGEGSVPLLVKPGLRILSPFEEFGYPLGATIDVVTTLDDDEHLEEWKKISWKLNGKPWKPTLDRPPHRLVLEKRGTNELEAEVQVPSEAVPNTVVTLAASTTFFVVPVQLTIDPARKVKPFAQGLEQHFNLEVKLGNTVVSELGKPVPWLEDGFTAEVEKIEWHSAFEPSQAGDFAVDTGSFGGSAKFRGPAAFSALATVTLRIRSTDPDAPDDEVFSLSAVRADFWAVSNPAWAGKPEGNLPEKAITEAQRTFAITKGQFLFDSETPITWSGGAGFAPPINLKPALAGGHSLAATALSFAWKGPGDQSGAGPRYLPFMKEPGANEVQVTAGLVFGSFGTAPFSEMVFSVTAESLSDLITPFVDPASFAISPGMTQTLEFGIEPKETPSAHGLAKEILVQGGNFKVEVGPVRWRTEADDLGEGNPISYKPGKREPVVVVAKAAQVKATENDVKPPALPSFHEFSADSEGQIVRLIAYPGEGFVFPASYPITLQATADLPNSGNLEWFVDGTSVGKGAEVKVPGLKKGNHVIKASLPGGAGEQRTITVFPWDFSMIPNRQAVAWPGSKVSLPVWLNAEIDGQTIASGSEIFVGKGKVTVTAVVIFTKADPEAATLTEFSKGVATCTFVGPCAFAASASGTFMVTQPGGTEEPYSFPQPNVLLGAVQAKAEYSFAFEPVRALVDMTRQFKIGSVTVTIGNHPPVVVENEIPATFSEPIEAVKALLPGQTPIRALGFDHWAGYAAVNERSQEAPAGLTLDVFFQGPKTRKIYWLPRAQTDSNWGIFLPEVAKKIKPQRLDELVSARVEISPSTIGVFGTAKCSYLYGPMTGPWGQPQEFTLCDGDYSLFMQKVDWHALASKPISISQVVPTISFSPPDPGTYTFLATGTFSITPFEGKDFISRGKILAKEASLLVNTQKIEFVKFYIPETEVDFHWENPENEMPWEKIYFEGKPLKIKIGLSFSINDLTDFSLPISIRTFSDLGDLEDWKEVSLNSDDRLSADGKSIFLTIPWTEAVEMGLFSSAGDQKSKFSSGDWIKDPVESNYNDGDTFDQDMKNDGGLRCGFARTWGGIASTPPAQVFNDDFIRSGGALFLQAKAGSEKSPYRSIQDQADYFYYSGHGNHRMGIISGGGGAYSFTPEHAQSYWNKNLDMVIFAGCSVFDIKDYGNRWSDPDEHAASPGEKWIRAGPVRFLGYNGTAPLDIQSGDPDTTKRIIHDWFTGGKTVDAWMKANLNSHGRNACAIDTGVTPWEYHYFRREGMFWELKTVRYDVTGNKWPDFDP